MQNCSFCLSHDRVLRPLGGFSGIYKYLAGNLKLEWGMDIDKIPICWECMAQLRKIHEFKETIINANNILREKSFTLSNLKSNYTLSKLKVTKPQTKPNCCLEEDVKTEANLTFEVKIEPPESTYTDMYSPDDIKVEMDIYEDPLEDCIHSNNELSDIPGKSQSLNIQGFDHCTMSEEDMLNMRKEMQEDKRLEAKQAIEESLPINSKERYLRTYANFMDWKKKNKATSFSETVFLTYFHEIAKSLKPTTLWAMFSMLRSTVQTKNDVNIRNYTKLVTFLKRQSDGFQSKKCKILSSKQIRQFLNEAPDEKYLVTKVVLILGISGACRSVELHKLTTHDMLYNDNNILVVNLRSTKTKVDRTFAVRDETQIAIVKKYQRLRPKEMTSDNFFLNYKNGKCTKQVLGKHKIGGMPKEIATYLNLSDADSYTGHCFRRSSANSRANLS